MNAVTVEAGRVNRPGSIHMAKNPLEKPPENQLEISYCGKSPKIGSLDMSYNQN